MAIRAKRTRILVPVTCSAEQCVCDGDCTRASGLVPNPAFSVETPFGVWSTGGGWVEGATASLSIDDGSGGVPEYSDTVLVERWGPESGEVGFSFDTQPFEILPGYVVAVDDGVTFKVLDVVDVTMILLTRRPILSRVWRPGDTWVY